MSNYRESIFESGYDDGFKEGHRDMADEVMAMIDQSTDEDSAEALIKLIYKFCSERG